MELKVGDKVKWIGKTNTSEWYRKMTSNGVVLRVGKSKAFVHWANNVIDRWHEIRLLEKI